MLVARMTCCAILFFPFYAFSAYNPVNIKEAVSVDQEVFEVLSWDEAPNGAGWEANTAPRLLSIEISDKISMMRTPYISPKHKAIAKKRCEEFGLIGISPKLTAEREKIKSLVARATRRHIAQFTDINDVRFEVLPEMKGTYVSLVCKLKPSAL